MPQLKSSTALTTSHHTNTARSFGRSRRVTTFPAPVKTDPARDLVAAIYAWGRIATPAVDPGPCPVAWCAECDDMPIGVEVKDIPVFHHSAPASVETLGFNGTFSDDPDKVTERTLTVTVERYDVAVEPDCSEPTAVHLKLGTAHSVSLGPAKVREFAAAITKARESAERLRTEGGSAERYGAVSIVRTHDGIFQVGAAYDATYDNEFGAVVFITLMSHLDATTMRQVAHGRYTLDYSRPDSWDLERSDATQLAAALEAAAALAAADRALAVAR